MNRWLNAPAHKRWSSSEIVAEIDSVLRNRETGAPEEEATASVENILAHMSAYMEAPAAA